MKTKLLLSTLAFAALHASAEVGTATATGASTPTAACTQIVEAAKTGDFKTMQMNSMTHHHGVHQGKKFAKMGKDYMEKIKSLTCGAEHIAGDRAFVESESGGEKRFIPFVQTDGQWKFDMKTYRSFYHIEKGPKAKRM